MKVTELQNELETFRRELIKYRDLWNESLEPPLPDYPVENIEELQSRAAALLRRLGRLRAYMEELHSSWVFHHSATGVSWNILDTAFSNDAIAQMKGPSLNALVDALQIILGRLDDYPKDSDFRTGQLATVNSDIELAHQVCARVSKAARALTTRRTGKQPFTISDEYDVQDLLHGLLRAYFKYPVKENPLPKAASAVATRADLAIEELGLIVEAKFVRTPQDQRRIEKDLAEDLIFYTAWEPLKYLFFVIYNSSDLENAELLEKFSKPQTINEKHFTAHVINV